jgi:hypothetical protein
LQQKKPVLLNSGIVQFFHLYTLFVWELTRDQYVVLLRLQINRDYGINATPVPVEWIEEGIREGWLKEFGMGRAEQQKVKQILLYGVGDQSFRDFVGPRLLVWHKNVCYATPSRHYYSCSLFC